jgi:hypothetical protein
MPRRVMMTDALLGRYAWEIDHGTPEGLSGPQAQDTPKTSRQVVTR